MNRTGVLTEHSRNVIRTFNTGQYGFLFRQLKISLSRGLHNSGRIGRSGRNPPILLLRLFESLRHRLHVLFLQLLVLRWRGHAENADVFEFVKGA
jgi:hypothetical protein